MPLASYKHYAIADDLTGKVFIVTGSSAGIGLATVRALAAKNATVIMACRNKSKTDPLVEQVRRESGNVNIHFMPLDVTSFESIRGFVSAFNAAYPRLDCLINNAGVAGLLSGVTSDGYTRVFGTNHVGTALVTALLLDKLKASAPSRIVSVSSMVHGNAKTKIRLDRVKPGTDHKGKVSSDFTEYAESKLATNMFMEELGRRLQGTGVTTYSLHPGVVGSDIWGPLPSWLLAIPRMLMLTNEQGAYTTLYCATSPEVANETGKYYDCCTARPIKGTGPAYDVLSKQLWDWTVKETGTENILP
ncbi:hypothetical protein RI367_002397 [Sorochytrium milnesiophthora]